MLTKGKIVTQRHSGTALGTAEWLQTSSNEAYDSGQGKQAMQHECSMHWNMADGVLKHNDQA